MPFFSLAAFAVTALRQPAPTMEEAVRRYTTDMESVNRYYSVPLSDRALARRAESERENLERLSKIDFSSLDRDSQVDYVLLRNLSEASLRDIETTKFQYEKSKKLLPFANKIVGWEEGRWTLQPINAEQIAGELDSMAHEVEKSQEEARKAMEAKTLTQPDALRASRYLDGLEGIVQRWFDHYNGYNPLFSWWCEKPYAQLKSNLQKYEKFLKEDGAGQRGSVEDPLVGDPIGRDRLNNDLRREMMAYTPEELIEIAGKEYDWCLKEMISASREMGCGDDWKLALEKTKADHVQPGEQDELIMAQGREAVDFVEQHDLVTLEPLCKETWRVNMLTAEQQKNWPFAFYGGQHMATSYPVSDMDHATKQMSMRGNNKHFMRAVTYHELIPGHHLQAYMSDRYRSYREVFTTPFFIEGWALHWEMLMWDLGFAKSPENKVGMLFWRMHRCARIVVSLKFHLAEMSPQQMIDYLVDKVGHERWTATSEVRRYVGDMYSPLYQCAYLIGGLQLRALNKDLVPSKMTPKQFHDKVLHLGPIPMEMIRASMTNVPFKKDFAGGKNLRTSF